MKKIMYMCVHTHMRVHTHINNDTFTCVLLNICLFFSFDVFLIKVICFSLCLYRGTPAWLCRTPSYYAVEHSPISWWTPKQVNPHRSVQFCWTSCLMLAVVLEHLQSANYAWLNHPSRVIRLDTALSKCIFPALHRTSGDHLVQPSAPNRSD